MIPEASGTNADDAGQAHRDLFSYCNAVMEPWDGPAAIAAVDGSWVIAGLDRNGLRPLRYAITDDGLLIAGSETGMVPLDESKIIEKGRVGPGQMLGVDLDEPQLLQRPRAQGHAGRRARLRRLDRAHHRRARLADQAGRAARAGASTADELRRRQVAVG